MTPDKQGLRWGVERRLEFIEFRLYWEGGVNRSDIIDEFGVSVPQASKDLTLYQEQAPENIEYDKSLKRYFATRRFQPRFISLDADSYLQRLATAAESDGSNPKPSITSLCADRLPMPQRKIRPDVLRSLLGCVREKGSIEIFYQSMSSIRPEPLWRKISPHAFGYDGLRWHVRAYCYIDNKFKDFILSRCLGAQSSEPGVTPISDDILWNSNFPVCLAPNPRLAAQQQSVIAEDFGMQNGETVVPVRKALLYYFSKRLRLDVAEQFDDPRDAPIVIKNRVDFDLALAEATK